MSGIPQSDTLDSGSSIPWDLGGQDHISTGVVKGGLPSVDGEDGKLWDVSKYEKQELSKMVFEDGVLHGDVWRDGSIQDSFKCSYGGGTLTVLQGRAIVAGKRVDLGLTATFDQPFTNAFTLPAGGNEKIIYLDIYERIVTPVAAFTPAGAGMDINVYADFSTYNLATSTIKEEEVLIGAALSAAPAGHTFLEIGRVAVAGTVNDTRVLAKPNQIPIVGITANSALAISSNIITATRSNHTVSGSGTVKQILTPVANAGSILVIIGTTGQTVTLQNEFAATGKLYLTGAADVILTSNNDSITLQQASDLSWKEISRSASLTYGQSDVVLTVSATSVTPTQRNHAVDTSGGAANLANIATTNMAEGWLLILRANNIANVVTLKHEAGGAGQIHLANSTDLILNSAAMMITLKRIGADWYEISRSSIDSATGIKMTIFTASGNHTLVKSTYKARMWGGGGGGGGSWASNNGGGPGAAGVVGGDSYVVASGNKAGGGYGGTGGSVAGGGHYNLALAASYIRFGTKEPDGASSTGTPTDLQPTYTAAGTAGTANTGNGGGGGTGNDVPAGGGGPGQYAEIVLSGTPGASIAITVGAGGAGGSSSYAVAPGGAGGSGLVIIEE